MKRNNRWRQYTSSINSLLLLLSGAILTRPGFAANTHQFQDIQSSRAPGIALPNRDEYVLAQISPSCRRVVNQNGLMVRQQPTASSQTIGTVNYGRNVAIESRGMNGWVPISAPLAGFVNANSLGACNVPVSVPLTNCRSIVAPRGINVRQTPSTQGRSVGFVSTKQRVTIENLGANGWVPIIVPFKGYVLSQDLAYCL